MPRILVIDDDEDLRTLLGQVLESAGYEVLLASNGAEGIKLFRQVPADLVLTDLFMPEREGLETIMELRRKEPGVAVIAMSGKTLASSMLAVARQLGAVETLEKSFSAEQLLRAVENALHHTAKQPG